ncbi:MAG: hypothetical protein H0W62_00985 [Chitinophagales bacterium]|nr:hypothetical protein [Chitinophagales bacterium]
MDTITSPSKELKDKILEFEQKRTVQENELKEEIHSFIENLRPSKIIKNAVNHIIHPGNSETSIIPAFAQRGANFVTQKLFRGAPQGKFFKMAGAVLKFAVANGIKRKLSSILRK